MIVVVFILLFLFALISLSLPTQRRIPRIIWTYWDGEDKGGLVKKCMKTWKKTGYEVRLVNRSNLKSWIPDVDILNLKCVDSQARLSDYVRLFLLYRYGGVWLDASIVVVDNFDWLEEKFRDKNAQLFAFHKWKKNDLHNESWFLAAPQYSPLVKLWLDEFLSVCDYESVGHYVMDCVENHNVYLAHEFHMMNYLAVYLAFNKVLKKHGTVHFVSEHANQFHFDDMSGTNGNIHIYCSKSADKLIKLTSADRKRLVEEPELQNCIFRDHKSDQRPA